MRLDGLTQYLVDVKQQFAGLTGHLGMVDQILDSLVVEEGRIAVDLPPSAFELLGLAPAEMLSGSCSDSSSGTR
mgnify:CR=1 FL=1